YTAWSSDVCSSHWLGHRLPALVGAAQEGAGGDELGGGSRRGAGPADGGGGGHHGGSDGGTGGAPTATPQRRGPARGGGDGARACSRRGPRARPGEEVADGSVSGGWWCPHPHRPRIGCAAPPRERGSQRRPLLIRCHSPQRRPEERGLAPRERGTLPAVAGL